MSFISIVAQEKFLTTMSDGRVSCNGKPTGDELCSKIRCVSPRFIVAFGGNRDLCIDFIHKAGLLTPNDGDYEYLADRVGDMLGRRPYRSGKVFVGFGGVNCLGEIEFFAMGTGDTERQHFIPKGDDISWTFFHLDGYEHKMDLRNEFIRYLGLTNFKTPEQVLRAQKKLNDAFAAVNPSMNCNTFSAAVTRSI